MKPMESKVALVTGAASGIGRAAATLLADWGAAVAAVDMQEDRAGQVADEINRAGGDAIAIRADVSRVDDVRNAMAKVEDRWDRLDVLVANAGVNGVWAPLDKLKPEEFDETISINLRGTFLSVKYALPLLKKRGGSIVITSSVNGNRVFSNTGATAYSCSKAGQVAFMKMAALELAEHDIRVNAICPGPVSTNIGKRTQKRGTEEAGPAAEYPEGTVPLTGGESGKPEEVGRLIRFLASGESSFISGTEIYIDGTESLLQG
ncbi:MAG: SDR family oxidoreductase [Phycisphaerae bacterium]